MRLATALATAAACMLFLPAARAQEAAPEATPAATHEGAAQHEATAQHEAATEAHEAGGAHGGGHGGGHWSLADLFVPESLKEAARDNLGESIIGHEPVDSITHVAFAVVVFLLVVTLMAFAAWQMKSNPDDLLPRRAFSPLAIFEVLTDALLSIVMEPMLGRERAMHFLPLVGSLGIFILFNNLMGVIPGFLPSTSNLNTTFALGSVVFIATHYYGVRAHGIAYFKHFFGPIIKWYALPLMLLMFCIELISHVARPVSLGIRLFGNMFGDHSALAAFLGVGVFGWVLIPIIPLPLGVLVCVVQTLVFCILSTVYIHLATEHEEEGGEGAHH
jgi:F-type H+-transporting ATPase subunit a